MLGLVFSVSFAAKGSDLHRFARQIEPIIETLGKIPTEASPEPAFGIAVIVVSIELILGVFLLTEFKPGATVPTAMAVIVGFIILTFWGWRTGMMQECGCFGALVRRTPQAAFRDGWILLGTALLGSWKMPVDTRHRKSFAIVLFAAGAIWVTASIIRPPAWAALKEGMKWRVVQTEPTLDLSGKRWFWIFGTDCPDCQQLVPAINEVLEDVNVEAFTGICSDTPGGVAEFMWDYEPRFGVVSISRDEIIRIGVRLGNVIELRYGIVSKIQRGEDFVSSH